MYRLSTALYQLASMSFTILLCQQGIFRSCSRLFYKLWGFVIGIKHVQDNRAVQVVATSGPFHENLFLCLLLSMLSRLLYTMLRCVIMTIYCTNQERVNTLVNEKNMPLVSATPQLHLPCLAVLWQEGSNKKAANLPSFATRAYNTVAQFLSITHYRAIV